MKGFVLIELLVAAMLFSLAGSGVYSGFSQAIQAQRRIHESFKEYDPARVLFLRVQKDLRNSVVLKDYPFKGKRDEIQFPVAFLQGDSKALFLVHYFIENRAVIRSIRQLNRDLKREKAFEKILLEEVDAFEFRFPYWDDQERLHFETFWVDEPYFGIPRAVEIQFKTVSEKEFLKLVSIPQGKMGRLQ